MEEQRTIVRVVAGATGTPVEARLVENVSAEDLAKVAHEWGEVISGYRLQMRRNPALRKWVPENLDWNWTRKLECADPAKHPQVLGVEFDGQMQGLMLVCREGYAAKLSGQVGAPLVYVSFLEIAPWNWKIRSLVPTPRLLGVGSVLMAAATQVSVSVGYQGRIGLHSLQQAEGFYRSIGMVADRVDLRLGLRYFETAPPTQGSRCV